MLVKTQLMYLMCSADTWHIGLCKCLLLLLLLVWLWLGCPCSPAPLTPTALIDSVLGNLFLLWNHHGLEILL